ncbi:hypothetical protein G9A89_016553 [Geosiphon pyriformis]|nr:hypothetical protein G9A89_016553 [Geosiphon pyriformis]
MAFQKNHRFFIMFLSWLFFLHLGGLYLFTRGFLLTRLVLSNRSVCSVKPKGMTAVVTKEAWPAFSGCWHPSQFKKAVIIVIDALRFDFTVPHPEKEAVGVHYQNKFPFINELLQYEPRNTLLFQFVADAPTTTLQRLKALTTGTLPTFIDAGSNFAGSAINEDNLIYQLSNSGFRIAFMGDDTWVSLFPEQLDTNFTFAFPSFNVKDLHSVDNGILQLLNPGSRENSFLREQNWDVLIAHFLGVDHCGHCYGPDHPAMAAKLAQMNQMIHNVVDSLDADTLLLVMGDHGMDSKGNHGGDSRDELESALLMYSKREFFDLKVRDMLNPILQYLDTKFSEDLSSFTGKYGKWRSISQIDIVPTLALLLGLPIPFNNLGTVIPEFFLRSYNFEGKNQNFNHPLKTLLETIRLNAHQVYQYVVEYSVQFPRAELSKEALHTYHDLFQLAESQYNSINNSSNGSLEDIKDTIKLYMIFLRTILATCRRIWAQFDFPLMFAGIFILTLSCLCIILHILRSSSSLIILSREVFSHVLTGSAFGVLFARLGILNILLYPLFQNSISSLDLVIFGAASGSITGFFIHYVQRGLFFSVKAFHLITLETLLAIFFQILHVLSFASNSYTVYEDRITVGFLQTYGILAFLKGFKILDLKLRQRQLFFTIGFLFLTRIAAYSTVCREEQMPDCNPTFYLSSPTALIILVSTGPIMPFLIRRFLNISRSYNVFPPLWVEVFLRAGLILCSAYWLLDNSDDQGSTSFTGFGKWVKNFVIRLAFGIAIFVGNFVWWSNPLCLNIQMINDDQPTPRSSNTPGDKSKQETSQKMALIGYENAFGASYFIYVTMVYLLVALAQKPIGGVMISLALCQIMVLLEIVDLNRNIPAVKQDSKINCERKEDESTEGQNLLDVTVFLLLATLYFFSTGHQATLQSIQWSAGFIGINDTSFIISPLLIVINTFGSQILFTAALPSLVFWKTSPRDNVSIHYSLARVSLLYIFYNTLLTTSAVFWAGWFRRHLMVWKVFAPRFMLAALTLIIIDFVMIFCALGYASAKVLVAVSETFKVSLG